MPDPTIDLYLTRFLSSSGQATNNDAYRNFTQRQVNLGLESLAPYGVNRQNLFDPNVINNFASNFLPQNNWNAGLYPSGILGLANFGTAFPALDFPTIQNQQNVNVASTQPTDAQLASWLFPSESDPTTPSLFGFDFDIYALLKKFSLILLALILLAFGLYLLATSTQTGKAALNLATKV